MSQLNSKGKERKGRAGRNGMVQREQKLTVEEAIEELRNAYESRLMTMIMERALEGDIGFARIAADKIFPNARGRKINLPGLDEMSGKDALKCVTRAIANGKYTGEDVKELVEIIKTRIQLEELEPWVKVIQEDNGQIEYK